MSFIQASEKLIYLAIAEQERSKGKPDSVLVREFYHQYTNRFTSPDTALCRAWLLPWIDTSICKEKQPDVLKLLPNGDTALSSPMFISSTELPCKVADELLSKYRQLQNKKQLIGPLRSNIGIWYFSVKTLIKGGKKLPFETVKSEILKELEIQNFPFDSVLQTNGGAQIKKQSILARAYNQMIRNQIDS